MKILLNIFKFEKRLKLVLYFIFTCFFANIYNPDIKAGNNDKLDNQPECYYSGIQKIFLHLNKDAYISGEELLFKGYLVNGDNVPDTLCKLLYIELMSPSNQKILSYSVNLYKGTCNSFFTLPDTLSTGCYFVKAFTNLMRNFDHGNYFTSKIIIANQADEKLEKLVTNNYHNYDSAKVNFYPESGEMLAGAENKIIFYISDFDEELQNIPIQILDDSSKLIVAITPDKRGIGEFLFKPDRSKKYYAQWNKMKFNFLPANIDGSIIHAQISEGVINVEVRNNIDGTSDLFRIVAYSNGNMVFQKDFSTTNGFASFKIPANNIPEGIIIIYLINSDRILAQRTIYNSQNQEKISLTSDKPEYGNRQKVKISVSFNNDQDKGDFNLSLSVSQKLPRENSGIINNLKNYFQLLSNLGKDMQNLLEMDSLSNFQINQILVTSKPVYNPVKQICLFLPENKGFIISGYVLSKSNEPVPNVCVYLSVADSFAGLKYCYSDSKGRFFFRLNRFYDNKNLIFQVRGNNNEFVRIELEDKFSGELSKRTATEYINPVLGNYLRNQQNISLSNKIFKSNNLLLMESENILNNKLYGYNFYGRPDAITYLSDFSDLDDFKDIVRNIMPGVFYNVKEKKVRVIDIGTQVLWPNEALILLNNIPFPDPAFVAKLGSKQIKKIELKKNHLIYGSLDIYGILSITTNQKNVYALSPLYANIIYPYLVRNTSVMITGPDYSVKNDPIRPDLRTTLYWNPEIKLSSGSNATFEFYTSDLKGTYLVEVQGISTNGTAISINKTIIVK